MKIDLGIDLGTTKIIIYQRGKGIVLEEPSIVAFNQKTDEVIAVGDEALKMLGRTPSYIQTECPIRDGVISNHLFTEYLIKKFVKKVTKSFLFKPRIAICVPAAITRVEARAVEEAAINAGARSVFLIEEPIAAAIGAGIDINRPNGQMIVDSGGGTTDIAVITLGGVVTKSSVKIAGNAYDESITQYIREQYKMAVGSTAAERIKKEIGCVYGPDETVTTIVKGRDLISGYPIQRQINQKEIYDIAHPLADEVVAAVKLVLEQTPPELVGDIYTNGITLTGGTSQLKGFDQLIAENIGVKVQLANNPTRCVGIGTGLCFELLDVLNEGFQRASTY